MRGGAGRITASRAFPTRIPATIGSSSTGVAQAAYRDNTWCFVAPDLARCYCLGSSIVNCRLPSSFLSRNRLFRFTICSKRRKNAYTVRPPGTVFPSIDARIRWRVSGGGGAPFIRTAAAGNGVVNDGKCSGTPRGERRGLRRTRPAAGPPLKYGSTVGRWRQWVGSTLWVISEQNLFKRKREGWNQFQWWKGKWSKRRWNFGTNFTVSINYIR